MDRLSRYSLADEEICEAITIGSVKLNQIPTYTMLLSSGFVKKLRERALLRYVRIVGSLRLSVGVRISADLYRCKTVPLEVI